MADLHLLDAWLAGRERARAKEMDLRAARQIDMLTRVRNGDRVEFADVFPSLDTTGRGKLITDPDQIEQMFAAWAGAMGGKREASGKD